MTDNGDEKQEIRIERLVNALNVMADGPDAARSWWRPHEHYGDVALSVQASKTHYCKPRVDGLPLESYESVEVGVLMDGHLVRPEQAGLEEFKDLFEEGPRPVAGYVPQEIVAKMREALKRRQERAAMGR